MIDTLFKLYCREKYPNLWHHQDQVQLLSQCSNKLVRILISGQYEEGRGYVIIPTSGWSTTVTHPSKHTVIKHYV